MLPISSCTLQEGVDTSHTLGLPSLVMACRLETLSKPNISISTKPLLLSFRSVHAKNFWPCGQRCGSLFNHGGLAVKSSLQWTCILLACSICLLGCTSAFPQQFWKEVFHLLSFSCICCTCSEGARPPFFHLPGDVSVRFCPVRGVLKLAQRLPNLPLMGKIFYVALLNR